MYEDHEEIFLSYQSGDRAKAGPVAEALVRIGWSVYWDRNTPIGKSWEQVLEDKLEGAKCVLVLWSQKSVRSKWVKIEASAADDSDILIPAVIEHDLKLPIRFRGRQNAMLVGWDGNPQKHEFQMLTRAIGGLIGYPEGSRRKLSTVRDSNRRILAKEIESRDYTRSPRSDQLFYHPIRPDCRIRLGETRARLELRGDKGWRVHKSSPLERPVDIFLKELRRFD